MKSEKFDRSKIMKRAWKLARLSSGTYFGSPPMRFFAECLKIAWAEAKAVNVVAIEMTGNEIDELDFDLGFAMLRKRG